MHKTHGRGGVFSVCDEETEKTKKNKIKQATAPPKQKTTAATAILKMEKQSTEQQK